ncbi:MAG: glycosyltransferase family 2 protein [Bacteroidales bacterium]|nr:glycosyltransferase family 2 protein [Bacteroidales bacterium]
MNNPLISVIVPIYKVEPYLRQCLDSIVNQTYTNLEIILVDDGSTDGCPAICDEYAAKDNRIIVIHKENGGLSDARNAGLDICKGSFIFFIDSDDWIGTDTINALHKFLLENNQIIIAISNFTAVYDKDLRPYKDEWEKNEPEIINSSDFLLQMLSESVNFATIGKMFRREIFDHCRFQVNKKNEDTLLISDLAPIIEEKKYQCINTPINTYYYRQRTGSICHDNNDPLEWHVINNYQAIIQKFNDRNDIVQILEQKKYDLVINLQAKLFKQKEYNEDLFISNQKKLHEIPLIFVLRTKPLVTFVYFLFMRYFPRILKFLHRVHSRQRP